MASTTLSTLLARLAGTLGEYVATATTNVAIGPDSSRWLISAFLRRDDGHPTYINHWAYITNVGQDRVIHEVPEIGALATQVPITTHVISTPFVVTWPLPYFTLHGVTGMQTLIAEAGWDVSHDDRLDITTVAGAYTYSLSTRAAWLDAEARVTGLYDPSISSMPPHPAPWRYGGLSLDGGSPTLLLRRAYLSPGGTAQLAVIRPTSSLVNAAESTTGPTALTDTVYGDPTELLAVVLLRCYRYLSTATHISDQERQKYAALVGPQEAWVRANVRHYLPRDEWQQAAPAGAAA